MLNEADQKRVIATSHEKVHVIRHEAVRHDLEPMPRSTRRQAVKAERDEAAIQKPWQPTMSVEDQVIAVASLIVEGRESWRRPARFEFHRGLQDKDRAEALSLRSS
jgi:hypothetical protein